jgi:hypothetical protein
VIAVEVQGLAPLGLVLLAEVVLGELLQVVAVIQVRWRVEVDAVVSPAESSWELGDGHDLEAGDAKRGELGKLLCRGRPGAFGGEGADVQLVENGGLESRAPPVAVGPAERASVDYLRGAVRAVGLKAGGGVGEGVAAVEAVAVQGAWAGVGCAAGEVAAGFGSELDGAR